MAKKTYRHENPEKQKLRDRIWYLNNQIRNATTRDEIEALIGARNVLQRELSRLEVINTIPINENDPIGAFCDSEIMI